MYLNIWYETICLLGEQDIDWYDISEDNLAIQIRAELYCN
jgi:hypothetical protein